MSLLIPETKEYRQEKAIWKKEQLKMLPEIKKHWAENDYQFPSKELIDAAIGFFKKYSDNLFSKYHIKISTHAWMVQWI